MRHRGETERQLLGLMFWAVWGAVLGLLVVARIAVS